MDYTIEELLEIWGLDAESEKPHPGWVIVAMLEEGEFGRNGGTTCQVRAGVGSADGLDDLPQTCVEAAFGLLCNGPRSRLEDFPVPVVKAEITAYANQDVAELIDDGEIDMDDIAESLSHSIIDWFLVKSGAVRSIDYNFDSGASLCGGSTSRFIYWASDADRFSKHLSELLCSFEKFIRSVSESEQSDD